MQLRANHKLFIYRLIPAEVSGEMLPDWVLVYGPQFPVRYRVYSYNLHKEGQLLSTICILHKDTYIKLSWNNVFELFYTFKKIYPEDISAMICDDILLWGHHCVCYHASLTNLNKSTGLFFCHSLFPSWILSHMLIFLDVVLMKFSFDNVMIFHIFMSPFLAMLMSHTVHQILFDSPKI